MIPLKLPKKVYSEVVRIKGYVELKTGNICSIPQVITYLCALLEENNREDINKKSELFTVLGPGDCLTLGDILRKERSGESYSLKIKDESI